MNFKQALENMKAGTPMKLPSWGGFWRWDDEKKTIIMHCREVDSDTGKAELDIRETQRVEYTLENILSEEWLPATKENTTILGGKPQFDFGTAIKYMKRGMKVQRSCWNGKNQYIKLATRISYISVLGEVVNTEREAIESKVIVFAGTRGAQTEWLASQADMLAEDWQFAE